MIERYTTDGAALLDSGFHIGDFIRAEYAQRIAAALNAQPQPQALDRATIRQRLGDFLRSRNLTFTEPFIDAAADAVAGVPRAD